MPPRKVETSVPLNEAGPMAMPSTAAEIVPPLVLLMPPEKLLTPLTSMPWPVAAAIVAVLVMPSE